MAFADVFRCMSQRERTREREEKTACKKQIRLVEARIVLHREVS